MNDGSLKSYDFNDNTFKTSALTTETASMTHRTGNNATTNTGIWTYRLATLTGFTAGNIYFVLVNNTGANPSDSTREFQFGSAEGDLIVESSYLEVDVEHWRTAQPDALSSGKLPADIKLWLTAAPAALTANGYVQAMLLRWLTDNAGGTPSALSSGNVPANTVLIEATDATDQIRDSILSDATRFAGANINATISSRSTYSGGAVASVTGNVGGDVTGKVLGGGASVLTGTGVQAQLVHVQGIKKNTALNAFSFQMFDTAGLPVTGVSVTSQRSIDGGAYASATNTATEITNGTYTLNLSATDLNGDVIMLRFSGVGANDSFVEVFTVQS